MSAPKSDEEKRKRWHEAYLRTAEKRKTAQKQKYQDCKEYWQTYYRNNPDKYVKKRKLADEIQEGFDQLGEMARSVRPTG